MAQDCRRLWKVIGNFCDMGISELRFTPDSPHNLIYGLVNLFLQQDSSLIDLLNLLC